MAIRHEFNVTSDSGEPVLPINLWVEKTLSKNEQKKFQVALERQLKYRQEAIDRGDLIVIPPSKGEINDHYVWKDADTATKGKPYDEEWLEFWNRYLDANKINFKIEEKNE